MKLLIITAVKAFEENVKRILESNGISSYSYNEVIGYRDNTLDAVSTNWFATEMNKNESLLFFAFVTPEASESVYESVEKLNQASDSVSKVHIAIAPIEKLNLSNK